MEPSRAHDAVEHEDLNALAVALDQGADVNERTSDGMTLLHHAIDVEADAAAQTGEPLRVATTKFLVDHGADLTLRWEGQTALEEAQIRGHHLAVQVIRSADGAPALLAVAIEDPAELETLSDQEIRSVELIAHGRASHDPAVREFAASRGWVYRQRNSLRDAARFAKTEFIVSWSGIDSAERGLLVDLIRAAWRHPEFASARAPHFDGIELWRVAAFDSSNVFKGGAAKGSLRGFSSGGQGLYPGLR